MEAGIPGKGSFDVFWRLPCTYIHLSALNCKKFCSVQDVRLSMSDCNMIKSSGVRIGLYIIMLSAKSVMLPLNRVG